MKDVNMMAGHALAHGKPKKAKKGMPKMHIQPAANGGFVVHNEPDGDDMMSAQKPHVMADVEALHEHIHKHYGMAKSDISG